MTYGDKTEEKASDLIENKSGHLIKMVQEHLPRSKRFSSTIGYFYLSGLRDLVNDFAEMDQIRLLIGNTNTHDTIEQLVEAHSHIEPVADELEARKFSKRSERTGIAMQTADKIRDTLGLMDQIKGNERLATLLIELLKAGKLQVRVYTRGRLSGRAHIFDYRSPSEQPGIAIVGSSNLTLGGLPDSTELNTIVRDSEKIGNHAALTKWFDHLWDDSQDFHAMLMHELDQSWAARPVSPWDIYLKTLHSLVSARDDNGEDILFDDEITRGLADFQRVAAKQAVSLIRHNNGCFVSDVVGLGKSFVGAAIVKHFERSESRRALIICPKPLEEMWIRYNERYELNAAIVPTSLLLTSENGIDLFDRYPDRDLILIDESHGFRNAESQRYEALSTYLQADDRKVCLLTATPRNSRAWDIFNQIKLFHPEDVSQLPIDPPDLRAFFKGVEDGKKSINDVLRHVMIRRTRRHVLRWWGVTEDSRVPMVELDDDCARPYLTGEKRCFIRVGDRENFFPRRVLETVRYSIEETYAGLYGEIRNKLGGPSNGNGGMALTYARYGLWRYLKPEFCDDDRYADLRRTGKSLRGLIRVMLFKRLESSVAAFRVTVERLLQRHELFAMAIERGVVPAGESAEALLGKAGREDDADILEHLTSLTQNYRIIDFDSDRMIKDLRNDIAVLRSLLGLTEPITAARDDKVQKLMTRLSSGEWAGRKLLIFTQFADTAEYLGSVIDPHGSREDVEVMFGQDKSKARVVGRFAPKANPAFAPRPDVSEIMILVATDVLSEGLNMQDCDLMVNYDLHWNPVRLIQRLGRIDRIGSDHEEIRAVNFFAGDRHRAESRHSDFATTANSGDPSDHRRRRSDSRRERKIE